MSLWLERHLLHIAIVSVERRRMLDAEPFAIAYPIGVLDAFDR